MRKIIGNVVVLLSVLAMAFALGGCSCSESASGQGFSGELIDAQNSRIVVRSADETMLFATSDATVYDMGTGHPERGSSPAAVIGSATGLSLMNPPGDGLSSLDVACYGVTSTFGETGVDPLHALIDNIEIRRKAGFSIIMR